MTNVKKQEQDNVPKATGKSSDTTEAQGVTPGSPSQGLREPVKVPPGVRSGKQNYWSTNHQMMLLRGEVILPPPYVHQESNDYRLD